MQPPLVIAQRPQFTMQYQSPPASVSKSASASASTSTSTSVTSSRHSISTAAIAIAASARAARSANNSIDNSSHRLLPLVFTPKTKNTAARQELNGNGNGNGNGNNSINGNANANGHGNCNSTHGNGNDAHNNSNCAHKLDIAIDKDANKRTPRSERRQSLNLAASPSPVTGLYYAPTQLINDEIDCGIGLIFQNLDDDIPLDQFLTRPGVRRSNKVKRSSASIMMRNPAKKNGRRKRRREEELLNNTTAAGTTTGTQESASTFTFAYYSARTSFAGVSVNLGSDHITTVAAAAALDIANKLYWGNDNEKPYYVLSEVEVMTALDAIGYGRDIDPGEFLHCLFTQERKEYFELLVDRALSSLGGRDEFYTDILCAIDKDHANRRSADSKNSRRRKKNSLEAKVEAKVEVEEKPHDDRKRKSNSKSEGKPEKKPNGKCQISYPGEHVIFDIDDEGVFTWRVDDAGVVPGAPK